MFTPSSNSKYLFNTLESLKDADPGHIVLYFDKINPNVWESSSYSDSKALDIIGKDRLRALLFGIRYSNKPGEVRLEMWEEKEEEKGIKKLLNSAPSTRNLPTPGWRDEEEELRNRLSRLREGGRKKTRGNKKSISIKKKGKSMKKKGKSMKKKGKSMKKKGKSMKKKVLV